MFLSGQRLPPTLRFSILKPLQLQREFTLSLEDSITWNKSFLIIDAVLKVFWWGSKAPQALSERARALRRSCTAGNAERLRRRRAGSFWFRVVPRPFLEGARALPGRGQLATKWKEAEFQAPRKAAGPSLGVALPGKGGSLGCWWAHLDENSWPPGLFPGQEDSLKAGTYRGHWSKLGAPKNDDDPFSPHRFLSK